MLNTDKMKIMFVLLYMCGGRAGDWSNDYIDQRIKDSTWSKYEDFVNELKVWFKDGDKICLVQNRLKVLKQGILSAKEYFICFDKIAREGGWKDVTYNSVKIGIIEDNMVNGLIDHIYNAEELPNTYAKWQKKIIALDRVWHRRCEHKQMFPTPAPQKKTT